MKKLIALLMAAAMLLTAAAFAEEIDPAQFAADMFQSEEPVKEQKLKAKYVTWNEMEVGNKLLNIWKSGDSYIFRNRINYGAEYYENPWMDVYTLVGGDGTIQSVRIGETNEQTKAFLDMITVEYLDNAYVGQLPSSSFLADAVTGATFSSNAVLYGVQAASYYGQTVYRMGERDVEDIQIKKLKLIVPGEYEKLDVDKTFTSEDGEVKYAAKGVTESGDPFVALVIRSLFVPADPENDMSLPTYQIWINTNTSCVFAANMLTGQFYEGFEMPADKLAAYQDVAITAADVFMNRLEVLVEDNPEVILTSATRVYTDATTGATPGGNDTSLSVRCCFNAAAAYYVGMSK